jgi:hypothetical protein
MKEMKTVKGVGPYAAENLLKLVGRYDGLALDSWTRAKFFKVRNNGKKTTDKKLHATIRASMSAAGTLVRHDPGLDGVIFANKEKQRHVAFLSTTCGVKVIMTKLLRENVSAVLWTTRAFTVPSNGQNFSIT